MYRHIFDRSNLDEQVAYDPRTRQHTTRLQDLEQHPNMWHRNDIVLFNGTRSGQQYSLHVTMDGFAGDTWILDVLTDEEYDQVEAIADRMRENARQHPICMKLIVNDPGVSH